MKHKGQFTQKTAAKYGSIGGKKTLRKKGKKWFKHLAQESLIARGIKKVKK